MTRRGCRKTAVALVAAILATAVGVGHATADQGRGGVACRPLDRAAILSPLWLHVLFSKVAFVGGFERTPKPGLERWGGPLVVTALSPPTWFEPAFAGLRARLACATGLTIENSPTASSRTNVVITFKFTEVLSPNNLARLKDEGTMSSADSSCLTLYSVFRGTQQLAEASIFIDRRMAEASQRSCLVRSMVHVLGLAAKQNMVEPSVLGDDSLPLTTLPANDQLLLRILYDPRLEIGMSRADVEERLDAVIADAIRDMTTPH